jgi:ribosomal-protein-alanine N-acetyltransferase
MTELHTERLLLIPLWREIVATRIDQDDFTVATPDGKGTVHVGPEWPGDPLPFFPNLLDSLNDRPFRNYAAVLPTLDDVPGEVVGMLGTKGGVNEQGAVEVGYGFNASFEGRGYATEAVGALVRSLLTHPDVRTVTAETSVANLASQRVLEKNGFVRTGTGWNDEDGDLVLWATSGEPAHADASPTIR